MGSSRSFFLVYFLGLPAAICATSRPGALRFPRVRTRMRALVVGKNSNTLSAPLESCLMRGALPQGLAAISSACPVTMP